MPATDFDFKNIQKFFFTREYFHPVSCCVVFPTEGLYRLRHQRQAAYTIHAREQAVLPVQDVEVRGVVTFRVRHYDFNRPQHRRPDDEGQISLLKTYFFYPQAWGRLSVCLKTNHKKLFFTSLVGWRFLEFVILLLLYCLDQAVEQLL